LRRPPRDSSRTRAVAVAGTSVTVSPRATSHCARCRPRPRAFSTAQRRSGNCFPRPVAADIPPAWRRLALSSVSREYLYPALRPCGSTYAGRFQSSPSTAVSFPNPIRKATAGIPTSSLKRPLSQTAAGAGTGYKPPREPARAGRQEPHERSRPGTSGRLEPVIA
jgi:hypothetical protein